MPIYERGDAYMVSVGSKGDRYRKTFKTKHEAEVAELQALARLKASGSPLEASISRVQEQPKGYTLKDAHDLTWRLRWNQDKATGTHHDACRCIFRVIPSQTYLADITPDMVLEAIEEWEDEGNSGSTINRKISHLNTMMTVAAERGWVVPFKLPRRKEGEHRIRWLSDNEEMALLNVCTHLGLHELRDLVMVAIDTGFRRGELLGLRPNDFVNGMVHLHAGSTKSDRARAVPATKRVSEILSHRAHQRKTFDLTVPALRHQWRLVKRAMKLEDDPQFVFHMLRHTCASRLVQRGVPLAVVQSWMGHSNIQTTLRYAHLAPENLLVAKEALEMGHSQPTLRVVNA